SFQCELVFAK
nr:RecName: Full=Ribulose bisphosphate carboxylase/oxygenase activase, chloroplastic; Short=RA; Short=RuBisCO activase; AltName: Full=Water stress-responsive protein 4 [Pinus pinaster]